MSILKTELDKLIIEGFESDYVFQTIQKTHNYYECEILKSWNNYINKSKVIFDVGANLGNHTMYWATHINPKKIYSFEPFRPTFDILRNNIESNNINNVIIIDKGVGEKPGFASIKSFDETNYGSTALQYEEKESNDTIEIINLDSFISENKIEMVDFVKIDVEGFELSVIKGMRELLSCFKPDLWIEVSLDTFREVLDILIPIGYTLVDIQGFNLLLLNEDRHSTIIKIDDSIVMQKMFYYLNRTNTYYNNYITTKKWLEEKNQLLEKRKNEYNSLKINYEQLNEKYQISIENYNKIKTWHSDLKSKYDIMVEEKNTKIQNLEKQVSNFENIKKQHELELKLHTDDLLDYYNDLNSDEEFIIELKRNIQKLETQNNYLKHENLEYKKKLSKITDTKIGRIGLKFYHILKKLNLKI